MKKQDKQQDVRRLFANDVRQVLMDIETLLIDKNRKYGDAALNPQQIFSRQNPIEQIKVRIDDKLTRVANQQPDEDEDVELDLLGYFVLLQIARKRQG